MNHISACEIKGTHLSQQAAAPDHMGQRIIDQEQPEGNPNHQGAKAHPPHNRPCCNTDCDDGKHHLIDRKKQVWNLITLARAGLANTLHQEGTKISNQGILTRKRKGIAYQYPHEDSDANGHN